MVKYQIVVLRKAEIYNSRHLQLMNHRYIYFALPWPILQYIYFNPSRQKSAVNILAKKFVVRTGCQTGQLLNS
jgi:hypothetical protein